MEDEGDANAEVAGVSNFKILADRKASKACCEEEYLLNSTSKTTSTTGTEAEVHQGTVVSLHDVVPGANLYHPKDVIILTVRKDGRFVKEAIYAPRPRVRHMPRT
ncbi:hypothetical protein QVD17_26349 [Tagetes erecta]|uniref:Uncharacterized protein n=1 Tax=Tagetes erecta TaxID=13708 RepID=A0AAD8K7B3_TARER|nr:hypothetical protein QVD17_26349 [Tagetes erecta]